MRNQMTDIEMVTIEPAQENAAAFAVWCLARDAHVQTVSAGGFLVPLDWYPGIPQELLYGAYVDGYLFDRPEPQPVTAKAPVPPLKAETTAKMPATRKRNPRTRKAPQE